MILIEDETISDVITVDQDREIEELVLEYIDWNPINLEHLYVSPGMIDFNIRRNREWEGLETLTKAALAGGVTVCVEEVTLEESDLQETGPIFCDVGTISIIEPSVVLALGPEDFTNALAIKGYLTPPNEKIGAVHDLHQWIQLANKLTLPLFLDPSVADSKILFMASPCRLLSLEQRRDTEQFEDMKLFGGAFRAEADSEDSEEEEEDIGKAATPKARIYRRQKSEEVEIRKASLAPVNPEASQFRRAEPRQQTLGHIPDFKTHSVSFKDIHSALEEQINESSENLESLCKAEMLSYKGVGQTMYQGQKDIPKSLSMELPPIEASITKKPGRRPTPLVFKPTVPALNADSIYLTQLAHYPDNMESKGVEKILSALKTDPCKVHIVNLCSATAISRIQKAKEERMEVTCETCPHFLYFTDQSIADGDTRLKNFPPIRNKANCNFLWELVKMNSVDAVCSQHVPVPDVYKFKPNFRKALSGIAGLGFTLQVLWTILKSPYTDLSLFEHYLVRLAKWTSSNPARILQLPNRGAIEKGFLADLVIWDPFQEVTVEQTYSSQGSQCPYLGAHLYGQIEKVIVRGKLAYSNKQFYPVGRTIRREDTGNSTRSAI